MKKETFGRKALDALKWTGEKALWLWSIPPVRSLIATRLIQASAVGAVIVSILDAWPK